MPRCHHIPLIPGLNAGTDMCGCSDQPDDSAGPVIPGATGCGAVETSLLQMDDSEQALFDCWATEVVDISGTKIQYYSLDLQCSTRDAVYDEPEELVWRGPYEIQAVVSFEGKSAEAREEGLVADFRSEVWIARAEVEAKGMPRPKEGDVICFWNIPFYDQFGSLNSTIEGAKFAFDVTLVNDDGHIFDGPVFVGFKLEIRRSTIFSAERRVQGDGAPRVV